MPLASVYPGLQLLARLLKTLKGSYYGSTRPRIDMPRLLDMYMDGKLKIDELVSRTFTLEQVNEAYEALKEGGVARSVVKFF